MFGVPGGEDIPVRDDGDTNGLFDLPNDVPVGPPGVHLHPGAPMDSDGRGTRLLADLCKFYRVYAAAVPSLAEFHRHRLVHRGADGLNNLPGKFRMAHQGGTVAGADDLAYGLEVCGEVREKTGIPIVFSVGTEEVIRAFSKRFAQEKTCTIAVYTRPDWLDITAP